MTERKPPATRSRTDAAGEVWSAEEKAAMRAVAAERRKAPRPGSPEERTQGEADVRVAIAGLPEPDRTMATRIHELVAANAPNLVPRTFYGMPGYARDGKVICFYQSSAKFKARYSTFGFQPGARLDDGAMWPVAWALDELTPAAEAQIAALVKKAAG